MLLPALVLAAAISSPAQDVNTSQPYANPDVSPLKINADYFGKQWDESNPFPGSFETTETGGQLLKVWPVN